MKLPASKRAKALDPNLSYEIWILARLAHRAEIPARDPLQV